MGLQQCWDGAVWGWCGVGCSSAGMVWCGDAAVWEWCGVSCSSVGMVQCGVAAVLGWCGVGIQQYEDGAVPGNGALLPLC